MNKLRGIKKDPSKRNHAINKSQSKRFDDQNMVKDKSDIKKSLNQ